MEPEKLDVDDHRASRREAIKKAAAAAAVSGVVWTAPRVEGLSIAPDYASAMTGGAPPVYLTIDSADDGSDFGTGCTSGTDYYYFAHTPSPADHNSPTPIPAPYNPGWTLSNSNVRAENAPVVLTANLPSPVGVIAAVTVTIPNTNDADREGGGNEPIMDVAFSGIDPPFNNCRVEAAGAPAPGPVTANANEWIRCPGLGNAVENISAHPGLGGNVHIGPQPYNNSPANQRNPTSSFSVPITITTGTLFRDFRQLRIAVRCD